MVERILRWLDDRLPVAGAVRKALDEEIVGGPSYAYTMGSAVLFLFSLQVLTGIWQLFYYVPSVDHAYNSVNYLRTQVPFGWLIHNLHYWGANAMIVLIGFHIARVFIFGAYKNPREATWLAGVVLLLVTAAIVFTGAPLPWDEKGYWAAEVGTSIMGTVPLVGDLTKRLVRAGSTMGPLALSRMFVLHVAILPAILGTFIAVHLIAFRRFGSVGPWDDAKRTRTGPFWPDQVFRDLVVAMGLLLFLVALCVFFPPPITGPADPLDNSYLPKPEWNFLFLYQALKLFHGPLEVLGTVGIPAIGVLILVLLPFLDRNPSRNPFRRPFAMAGGIIWVGLVLVFTVIGYYSNPSKVGASLGSQTNLSASAQAGARLVGSLGCQGCHKINGSGGSLGPDLSDEGTKGRSREWLITQLRDPKSHDPNTAMPSFSSLSDAHANQIVDYLLSLGASSSPSSPSSSSSSPSGRRASGDPPPPAKAGPHVQPASRGSARASGAAAPSGSIHGIGPLELGPPGPASNMIGSAQHGQTLYGLYCSMCHGTEGKGGVPNPGAAGKNVPALNPIGKKFFSPDPQTFAENIDRLLQHGAIPSGSSPEKAMLGFGKTKSLTQQEIANLEAYVLSLNGVDRARIEHPGVEPETYFVAVAGAFVLAAAALWGYGALRRKPEPGRKE